MRKRFIVGLVILCVAFFVGEYAYFNHQASANRLKPRYAQEPRSSKATIVIHSKTKKPGNEKLSKKQIKQMVSSVSNDGQLTKPEYTNVNDFISETAHYYNQPANQKGSGQDFLQKQIMNANAVDEYVDYYKPKVRSQSKRKRLLKAQWAAENYVAYKKPKYLHELKNIFDRLNQDHTKDQ